MEKKIFTTIEYVAEKIKEAITGHKNDEQAHPQLSKQIEVLSYKYREAPLSALDDLPTLLGITPKNGMILGTMFSETIAPYLFGGTRYTVEEYYYLPTYRVQIAKGSYQNTGYMKERKMINGVWGEWVDYSTTTKTDILSSELLNGWVFDDASIEENIIKTGNIVSLHLVIKNPAVQGNNSHIYTIPSQYRPTKIVARDTKLRNSNTSIIIEVLPTGILRCNGYTEVNRTLSIDISWGVLT